MSDTSLKFAPGPDELPEIWANPLKHLVETTQQYGDIVCLDPYNHQVYLVNHPNDIKYVLQDNYRNYRQAADSLKVILGEGLTVSNGDLWLRQRRLMQPAFHQQRLVAMVSTITDTIKPVIDRWQTRASQGEPFDLVAEMMHLTLAIIAKTMFSVDVSDKTHEVVNALTFIEEYIHQHAWDEYTDQPEGETLPEQLQFQETLTMLDQLIYNIINQRRRQHSQPDDLLTMLLEARDEATGTGLSEQQLRDEVMTIFTAGSETSALTLAWAWYLLAQHPPVEARLQQELAAALGDRTPAFKDLATLTYPKMIIEETLRLYPPSWLSVRRSLSDDEIGGYHIPANSEIFLCPYITQRHPAFWENPEQFDPERFGPAHSANRPRFAYFPFGGGPRICIGNNFALMEMQLILAMLAQTYHLRLAPGHQVEPQALVSLKPHGGLPVTVHLRSALK